MVFKELAEPTTIWELKADTTQCLHHSADTIKAYVTVEMECK